jgi:hypothetical protein
MKYPDIEGEAIKRDAEIARKAEMFDRFVKHVIEKETLLDKSEYAMLGIDDVQAEVIHTRALNRIMRNRRYGR